MKSDVIEFGQNAHDFDLYLQIVNIIDEALDEEGVLYKSEGKSQCEMIGYKFVPYKNTCYDGEWPLVSVIPQTSSVNIYIMVVASGEYLVPSFVSYFGKSNCGKSCIRIKKLNDKKLEGLNLILDAVKNELNK